MHPFRLHSPPQSTARSGTHRPSAREEWENANRIARKSRLRADVMTSFLHLSWILAYACEGQHFHDHEQRSDEQSHDVVEERGLAPFECMADQLQCPPDDERADADRQPREGRLRRTPRAEPQRQREQERHDEGKTDVEQKVIREYR